MAREGKISPQMSLVAEHEGLEAEFIRQGMAEGTIVIPTNIRHENL
ncbi:MAG: phosphomethylpyrimidine synthase ThiC, partial [Dehalococcoidia bacterium]